MKNRCIMIFPKFSNEQFIEEVRENYDPLFQHVKPHITLVFPFESEIETKDLKNHLITMTKGIHPFYIKLKGITPSRSSTGNYLFLNIEEGTENIIELHHRLYTGILKEYMPKWLKKVTFFPHLTVGSFDDEIKFLQAIEDTKDFPHEFTTLVDTITVEIIDDNEDSIIELEISLE